MAPHYRVTVVPRQSSNKPYNLGKTKDGERFYTASQVEDLIPRLRGYNARGYDVYISPIDPNYHYLLVDDMSQQKLSQVKSTELKPCLIQKSSADNFQAILKVPKVERSDEQSLASSLCGQLNKHFGDPKLSGAIHPFRMAGFSNRKQGRRNAFTKVVDAVNQVCRFTAGLLDKLRKSADQEQAANMQRLAEQEKQMRLDWIERQADHTGGDTVAEYRRSYRKFAGLARSKGWPLDGSVLDYRVCRDLLKKGHSSDDLKTALLEASPSVSERHSDPDGYADRTVDKAAAEIKRDQVAKEAQRPQRQRGRDLGDDFGL